MGLTVSSTGGGTVDGVLRVRPGDRLIALAGNPNVGKSTLFNRLTGLRQHTGNWPGKTVGSAFGYFTYAGQGYTLADTPGAYSLAARSAEEELARDFICFGGAQAVAVVCDAVCPERSLILALQILEITGQAVICLNLMDEARKKGIYPDPQALALDLGVPVVGMSAASGAGVEDFLDALGTRTPGKPLVLPLPPAVEAAAAPLAALLDSRELPLPGRWLALRLLEGDASILRSLEAHLGLCPARDPMLREAVQAGTAALADAGLSPTGLSDLCAGALARMAETLCRRTVRRETKAAAGRDRRIDRVLTHRVLGFPVMLALLALTLWLTITGANAPSAWLSTALFALGDWLRDLLSSLGAPAWLYGLLIDGMYATLAWVVSVMLPPMAIFFPLFTLMEDVGYLPRVAFNLDGFFKKCAACGKQGLTMCMGLGCNAAGVVGCRIIDSPREKLIAVLTNSFMPCNGRFPTIITLIALFFAGSGLLGSAVSALGLTGLIVLGVAMTLLCSRLLSRTILRGVPSSFTLELPPYRKPQISKVIVRSILDRTLFVLGRAVSVAAPAGLLLWLLANVSLGGATLLAHLSGFLDPLGRLMGLDGVILLAFLLGLPANEIVLPIVIMCYLAQGHLVEMTDLAALRTLLADNGWTAVTALCFMLFSLMHWPCSTTLITIKKETGSWFYTGVAALLPTACGLLCCLAVKLVSGLLL